MKEQDWRDRIVKELLLNEAEGPGSNEARRKLPEKAQRLLREVEDRQADPTSVQGRRGSPASYITSLYPVVLYLVSNGLSSVEAWSLVQDGIPERDFRDASRQLNRARSRLEKADHKAACAIVDGKPKAFEAAYRELSRLCE